MTQSQVGKIGSTVADMIAEHHGLPVTLADAKPDQGDQGDALVRPFALDVENAADLHATTASS